MSDPRREKVNRCFEAGMSKAADEIYNDYRLTKRNKELCLGNIDVVNICKKYDFTPSKMTSVPILIKSMVEHMIKSGALKDYIGDDDKQNKVYALGKFALLSCIRTHTNFAVLLPLTMYIFPITKFIVPFT